MKHKDLTPLIMGGAIAVAMGIIFKGGLGKKKSFLSGVGKLKMPPPPSSLLPDMKSKKKTVKGLNEQVTENPPTPEFALGKYVRVDTTKVSFHTAEFLSKLSDRVGKIVNIFNDSGEYSFSVEFTGVDGAETTRIMPLGHLTPATDGESSLGVMRGLS